LRGFADVDASIDDAFEEERDMEGELLLSSGEERWGSSMESRVVVEGSMSLLYMVVDG
jgi:hypothetical protein